MRSFTSCILFLVLLPAATLCWGAEFCVEPFDSWGCFPCDLPIQMDWIGYSTSGPACSAPAPAPDDLGGWWLGLWTLSASATDPYVNVGPPANDLSLYLWLVHTGCGYGFNSGGLVLESDYRIDSYEHLVEGFHSWMPNADQRSGVIQVAGSTPCHQTPEGDPPRVLGVFELSRLNVESKAVPEARLSVEDSRWGRIKGLYR